MKRILGILLLLGGVGLICADAISYEAEIKAVDLLFNAESVAVNL